jgi:uncharacterized membrane-anchored protein YitT (DUF2179 family)
MANSTLWGALKRGVSIAIGAGVATLGLQAFLIPNHLTDGGIVGVSIIAAHLARLPIGIFLLCVNAPFIYLGYKKLGRMFAISSIADKYFSKILEKAKSPLEKVRVYELKIAMSAGRGERAEAIRLGLEVLGLLGVKLTSSPSASSVKAELGAADKSLSGKNPDRLVDLHLMEEESNKAAMRVLMQIATPAFAGNAPLFYSIIAQ